MDEQKHRIETLTVYLVKEGVTSENVVDPSLWPGDDVVAAATAIGTLHTTQVPVHPPSWAKLLNEADAGTPDGLISASAGAVLLIQQRGRILAITFGTGRHRLQPGVTEEAFGLRTTLNSVDPEAIRSIDRQSIDSLAKISREQMSRASRLEAFGLDVEQDLLRSVHGVPIDDRLGLRMGGSDALAVGVRAGLAELPALMDRYLEQYEKTTYREEYAWIDQIQPVRDREATSRLDLALSDRLLLGDEQDVWLAAPEIIPWASFGGFRYGTAATGDLLHDIDLASFRAAMRSGTELGVSYLRAKAVMLYATDGTTPLARWTAYRCLYAEQDLDGDRYILTNGKWYRLDKDFVSDVDNFIDEIAAPTDLDLPAARLGEREDAYNRRAATAASRDVVLMDANLIQPAPGQSRIEFCDLYDHTEKRLVHVKKYGGSSVLSHLFSQGLVSATLLATDRGFRGRVNEKLPPVAQIEGPIDTSEFVITFAVITKRPNNLRLPFFSKVNLRQATRNLRAQRFRVELAAVAVEN